MPNLIKVTDRAKLKPRREPYWHKLAQGCFVGFRKMTADSGGTWSARMLIDGKQNFNSLGDFSPLEAHQCFDAASKEAQIWFKHMGAGGRSEVLTVMGACEKYIEHLRSTKGEKSMYETQNRINRLIKGQRIAKVELNKLKPTDITQWRTDTDSMICARGGSKGNARSPSAINRDSTALRSALNFAHAEGYCTSDFAWKVKLKAKNEDKRREVYLDREQRKKLIAACDPELALLVKAMTLLPVRPGALALLNVANYDKRQKVLTIGHDKVGAGRKLYLPDDTAAFFADQCKNKLPGALIFSNCEGRTWINQTWGRLFRIAAKSAGLPVDVSLYSLRHAVFTDLVKAGADLMTIAQLGGTSVLMLQKNYSHLTQDHARSALATLAL
jgi:integrase